MMALVALVAVGASAATELVLPLPDGGFVALSTRGSSALRVRLLRERQEPFETPMVAPVAADVRFTSEPDGIVAAIGALKLGKDGRLMLFNAHGTMLTSTKPLNMQQSASIVFEGGGQRLYGRGGGDSAGTCAGANDGAYLSTNFTVSPRVQNCATYVPYYYSTLGYSALGAVNATVLQPGKPTGGTNTFPLSYTLSEDGTSVSWAWEGAAISRGCELYLMPAPSLNDGTRAYYSLVGAPLVPPRWAFGFIMCRWGWSNRTYLEDTLSRWRSGRYPSDAFIMDFGWVSTRTSHSSHPLINPSARTQHPILSSTHRPASAPRYVYMHGPC